MPAIGLRIAAVASASRPSAAAAAALILAACLSWLGGVALHLGLADLPAPPWLRAAAASGVLALLLAVAVSAAGLQRFAAALLLLGAGLLGWAGPGLVAERRIAERLPAALEATDLVVTGVVADLPHAGANGLRFAFDVERALRDVSVVRIPPRLIVGWYVGREIDASLSPAQRSLRAGQRWQLTLRLRRPHGNMNPHGFDYELYLFERGIGATAYVREVAQPARLLADGVGHRVAALRQTVRDAIFSSVDDRRAAGVLAALAVGDQGAIDRDDWQLFRDTGIAHLVAISGLHVTMFFWLAGRLIAACWRRSPRLALAVAAPVAGRCGGLAAATAYALIAGWGVPAQRTLLMLALVVLLASLGRRWPWPMILLAAAVLVTLLDPWALLQPGFWLSFVAVGLLLASGAEDAMPAASGRGQWRWKAIVDRLVAAPMRQLLRSQLAITVGLAPLSIIFFQQLSVVGLMANLVAIPLVTLLITPLALLGVALPWLWQLGALLLQGLTMLLGWLASWPFAVWTVAEAPLWAHLLAIPAALLAVLPLPWRTRLLALPLLIPLLLPPRVLPAYGQFDVLALDVGQGTAVLVRTHSHLLLFDTGPHYARDSDAGQRIVLPLLRGRGERRIDKLVLSHRDNDHVGGAASLIGAMAVGELFGSLEDGHPLANLGPPLQRCSAGLGWQWDGVSFEMLHPLKADYDGVRKPNAMSCVLRVAAAGAGAASLLITGDIERQQELELLSRAALQLPSRVLIAPHHGSRTSSIEEFIEAVGPQVVVFQAGYRNRFGHPSAEVVDRYRRRGIQVIETSRCGAWWWRGGDPLQAVCERERQRRYWHDRPA
ncbi:DNA internalization-related competence protein ComEC/Rec2 [Piscinibacter sakaiensis]|uniref:DNA internalization-related competence protein ComEC/Rec2 n=1 Tax=Piscinibacter sakaiensis TaxID=1547922 RepID=UPI003AB0AEB3